ncbi:cilia- and flagella-associated protein [Anaeramoeba flamelloides]|uniref:Cilia- and flagella-associated protein n=1 Tax=Anaeramoeba flamelloides TaxID=1746091 RepID=A0AAV7ZL50_9EUKA|nr:cilia- and flagella-associated protein [Anaeramoeba flamelloides]
MLTIEKVLKDCPSNTDISQLANLNLWGGGYADVSLISQMKNLEVITLSLNQVKTLKPFSNCTKLRELIMRKNKISDLRELKYLGNLKHLTSLWLKENPVAYDPNYKQTVIQILPQLKKLDGKKVSEIKLLDQNLKQQQQQQQQEQEQEQKQQEQQKQQEKLEKHIKVQKKREKLKHNKSKPFSRKKPKTKKKSEKQDHKSNSNTLSAVLLLVDELDQNELQLLANKVKKRYKELSLLKN